MKLNLHFDKLHSNVSLNIDRVERIRSAISNLEKFLQKDEELSEHLLESFEQGSFATDTAIKPISEDEEFDVDVVLLFNLLTLPVEYQTPKGFIGWLASRLRENKPHYDGKVREKNRCVRINYAGDFYLDIVPANCNGNVDMPILIPNKEDDNWQLTHPKGFITWISDINERNNKKFNRIMKMLKHWRDHNFGQDSCPCSILFTTLIGSYMKGCPSDAESLVLTMENLSTYLDSLTFVPAVFNPSLLSENLAKDWEEDHFKLFKERFIKATSIARQAFDEEDRGKSIENWQKLFPEFPSSIEEDAKALANAIKLGSAFVTSSGGVTSERPTTGKPTIITPHRSYGD